MKRGRGGLQTRQPGWGGLKSIEGAREEIICRKFQRETQVQNPEAGTGLVSFKEQRGKYWGVEKPLMSDVGKGQRTPSFVHHDKESELFFCQWRVLERE